MMLTCTLDAKSRVTLTDQLYGALREEIEQGRLKGGEKMPSKRQLSACLHPPLFPEHKPLF